MTWEHDQDHIDRPEATASATRSKASPPSSKTSSPHHAPAATAPRSNERLLPISEKVLTAKTHLHQTLASWALLIAEEAHATPRLPNRHRKHRHPGSANTPNGSPNTTPDKTPKTRSRTAVNDLETLHPPSQAQQCSPETAPPATPPPTRPKADRRPTART